MLAMMSSSAPAPPPIHSMFFCGDFGVVHVGLRRLVAVAASTSSCSTP
jgi:hypothetical protein